MVVTVGKVSGRYGGVVLEALVYQPGQAYPAVLHLEMEEWTVPLYFPVPCEARTSHLL